MSPISVSTIAIVALRAAAHSLSTWGENRTSDSLHSIADAIESGKATDEHMRLVAEKLRAREVTDDDWNDVMRRINQDTERLQGPYPDLESGD